MLVLVLQLLRLVRVKLRLRIIEPVTVNNGPNDEVIILSTELADIAILIVITNIV